MLEYLDKIFKLGEQLPTAVINTGVLGITAATMLQPYASLFAEQIDFLTRSIRQLNNLTQGVVLVAGRMMTVTTAGSC